MRQQLTLIQDRYRDWHLRSDGLMERLNNQTQHLQQLESALLLADTININTKVAELDFELLRYTCSFLETRFEEAARHDCAQLIVESILDVSGGKESGELWDNWLGSAPCWPPLAESQWYQARNKAAELLNERLKSTEVVMDQSALKEILRAMGELTLRELLSPEIYAEMFPGDSDDEEQSPI